MAKQPYHLETQPRRLASRSVEPVGLVITLTVRLALKPLDLVCRVVTADPARGSTVCPTNSTRNTVIPPTICCCVFNLLFLTLIATTTSMIPIRQGMALTPGL